MRGFLTRGQPAAVEAASSMLAAGVPHALLLTGPGGVGKTTLAFDIAAGLLCVDPDHSIRPCRACRACRAIAHGNHPDLHRLGPTGAGATIPIGGGDARGVRDLVRDLALMPVEGGARIAVVESAERMSEDAQSALLKTLEEPPSGTVLMLCAEDDERLLPTIRSRCVRIRLGPVGLRGIEEILVEHGVADAPTAARLGRLSDGRPGVALALAEAPDAARMHDEISRSLLDLLAESRTGRLTGVRDLAGRAAEMLRATQPESSAGAAGRSRKGRARGAIVADLATESTTEASEVVETTTTRIPAAERRAAALALVAIWRSIVRDLALVGLDARGRARDSALLDDLEIASDRLPPAAAGAHLRRLDVAGERLEGNVSPELVLDDLALGWGARAAG